MSATTEPSLHTLIAENRAAAQHLRTKAIPHQIGMAAACRALAVELPRSLAQQLESDVESGVLAERWRVAQAMAAAAGDFDPLLGAVALVVKEQTQVALRHLALRGKAWTAESYRLEGQADALEAQTEQLCRFVLPVTASTSVIEPVTSDERPVPAAADQARAAAIGVEG
jgi:hypothetical protein